LSYITIMDYVFFPHVKRLTKLFQSKLATCLLDSVIKQEKNNIFAVKYLHSVSAKHFRLNLNDVS